MSRPKRRPAPPEDARRAPSSAPILTPPLRFNAPPRWVLPSLLLLHFVLGVALIARVGPFDTPDAPAHYLYVERLVTRGTFPVFAPTGGNDDPGFEFHQPPLYYLACAPLWAATGAGVQQYACRFVSLLCGLGVVWLGWRAARHLSRDPVIPVLTAGLLALWPLHLNVGAMANNDAMAGLLCAAIFERLAALSKSPVRTRDAVVLGVLAGGAVLSKSTALVVAVVAVAGVWILAEPAGRVKSGGIAVVVALLVGGPWLARNQLLYGDPLVLGLLERRFADAPSRTRNFLQGGVPLDTYLRALLLIMFCTAWGFFGGPNAAITMLNPFGERGPWRLFALGSNAVVATLVAMLACAAASVIAVLGSVRAARRWDEFDPRIRTVALCWMLGASLVVLAWARFNLGFFQAQARYLHPAILPFAFGFALGWREILGRGRALKGCATGFALVLCGLTLWNVLGWQTLTDLRP